MEIRGKIRRQTQTRLSMEAIVQSYELSINEHTQLVIATWAVGPFNQKTHMVAERWQTIDDHKLKSLNSINITLSTQGISKWIVLLVSEKKVL